MTIAAAVAGALFRASPARVSSCSPAGLLLASLCALTGAFACAPFSDQPREDAGSNVSHRDAGHGSDDAGPLLTDAGPSSNECPDDVITVPLEGVEGERFTLVLSARCEVELNVLLDTDALVEVSAPRATLAIPGVNEDEPGWLATRPWSAGEHTLIVLGSLVGGGAGDDDEPPVTLTIASHGPPVGDVVIERSLVWTQPALVDDAATAGLGRVLGAVSADGHGGRLLEQWLTRFSTTAHSERAGPTQFLDDMLALHGDDPSLWDLDALPFVVTAVHNRLDLRDDESCGELRVSLASLHEVWRPLHLIFLFRQPKGDDDVSPGGALHCHATARRWARLSLLDDESFLAAARAILDEGLVSERFLMAESEELTVSPWEWRQWVLVENPVESERDVLPLAFENVPLFQTVDIAAVNAPGALRESFLAFVADNAAALDERRALIPAQFRPLSVRVNSGVPWVPLDLEGVGDEVLSSYPRLRQRIETVGCAGCHLVSEFVQTREDRSFSAFYEGELTARRQHLTSLQAGALVERAPFGALQEDPPLTP